MRHLTNSLLTAGIGMLVLASGTALAQSGGPPANNSVSPVPGTGDSVTMSRANRDQQANYNSVVGSMDKPAKGKPTAVPATAADIAAGAGLRDVNGQPVGKVSAVAADGVVIDTGQGKIKVPLESFGKDDSGLLIAITAQQFGELVAQASRETEAQAQAALQQAAKEPKPATAGDIVAGAALRDVDGKPLGKVTNVSADGATVDTGLAVVKLPLDTFGKDDAGLVIGITGEKLHMLIADSRKAGPEEQ